MPFEFKQKTVAQLKANYYRRETNGLNGFNSFTDFLSWYNDIEEKKCHYCGVLEKEVQKIVVTGLITSKRFPQNGNTGRGQARGMWLEVDKFNPNGLYSRENCVLACYFCNNDKSDIFGGQEYLIFFQNRANYIRNLLNNN
jgi:5-methylcytosine-specific restriction endonuclease McrA